MKVSIITDSKTLALSVVLYVDGNAGHGSLIVRLEDQLRVKVILEGGHVLLLTTI